MRFRSASFTSTSARMSLRLAMRTRSPDPANPPGTAISPTSLSFARMTPSVAVVQLGERVAAMHRLTLFDEVALDPPGEADADRHVAVARHDVARAGEDGRRTGLSRRGDGGIGDRHGHRPPGKRHPHRQN